MDRVRRIADAVLYEGYVLWPYRRSAHEEPAPVDLRRRLPAAPHARRIPTTACVMQTQCLAQAAPTPRLDVRVRFLHVVERSVARLTASGREPVDELVVGRRAARRLGGGDRTRGRDSELRRGVTRARRDRRSGRRGARGPARHGGRARRHRQRSWRDARGRRRGRPASSSRPDLSRITVRISNASPFAGGDREEALRADVLLDPHGPAGRGRRARVADRSAGDAARRGRALREHRHLAGARRRARASATRCCRRRSSCPTIRRSRPRARATCSTRPRSTSC